MATDSYKTKLGDTWDKIALKVYGSEKYTEYLMANNQTVDLLSIVIFDSGRILNTPALTMKASKTINTPPWRSS